MKLLFDENLSSRLVRLLEDAFPGSSHVDLVGLRGHRDVEIWEVARRDGLTIVSKDRDFADLSILRGHPPKVVLLRVGNAGTSTIASILTDARSDVRHWIESGDSSLLEISR